MWARLNEDSLSAPYLASVGRFKDWVEDGWNHLDDASLMCLVIDPAGWNVRSTKGWDTYWAALCVAWASYEHGSWIANIWGNGRVCHARRSSFYALVLRVKVPCT